MAGYTITITPNDDEAGPQTTIRVDTGSGGARITELTVRAADGGGLIPAQLPAVNLEQLIAAVTPASPAAITTAPAPVAEPPTPAEATAPAVVAEPESEPEPAVPAAKAARPARARVASSHKATAKRTPVRGRQAKVDKAAAEAEANGRRAYRRMPEPHEVLTAYREVGGTTALARHYGVPRHTATGWLRRLRSQGLLEA